tara:strand:- start:17896 stop:18168 length:273 start_codon:yes stop_codon:yes gene_type:complete
MNTGVLSKILQRVDININYIIMNQISLGWSWNRPWNMYMNTDSRDLIYDPFIKRVIYLGKLEITIGERLTHEERQQIDAWSKEIRVSRKS